MDNRRVRKRNPLWKDTNKSERNKKTNSERYQKLNSIAMQCGYTSWPSLQTAVLNGECTILTNQIVFERLMKCKKGVMELGDGLTGLVYATLYDVARSVGLSQEQAEIIRREDTE